MIDPFSAGLMAFSTLMGAAQQGSQNRAAGLDNLSKGMSVGAAPLMGMMTPFKYGNVSDMVGGSGNNAYNTAMSPTPQTAPTQQGSGK